MPFGYVRYLCVLSQNNVAGLKNKNKKKVLCVNKHGAVIVDKVL